MKHKDTTTDSGSIESSSKSANPRRSRSHKVVMSLVVVGTVVSAAMVGHVMADGGFRSYGGHGGMGDHGPKRMLMSMVQAIDTDKSGSISREEVNGLRDEKFARYDGNSSGDLTLEEFQGLWMEMVHPLMVDHFQMLDHDGNGQVTKMEFSDPVDRVMSFLDENGDGEVTLDEAHSKHGKRRHHNKS